MWWEWSRQERVFSWRFCNVSQTRLFELAAGNRLSLSLPLSFSSSSYFLSFSKQKSKAYNSLIFNHGLSKTSTYHFRVRAHTPFLRLPQALFFIGELKWQKTLREQEWMIKSFAAEMAENSEETGLSDRDICHSMTFNIFKHCSSFVQRSNNAWTHDQHVGRMLRTRLSQVLSSNQWQTGSIFEPRTQ